MTYVPCGDELLDLVEEALRSVKMRREILMNQDQLREILNCVLVRRWLQEQACQDLDREQAAKVRLFIVEIMQYSGNIWRGGTSPPNPDDYTEALSRTWEWFNRRLCSGEAKYAYDPDKSSFTTWFNSNLRFDLLDVIEERRDDERRRMHPPPDGETNPLDNIPAPTINDPTVADQWLSLVQRDDGGRLRRSRMQCHPHVTCQKLMVLILQHLGNLSQIPWTQIAQDLGVDQDSLIRFYRNTCRHHFRQFLQDNEWL